jgi:branched-chain amino acid transport system permease protein
VSVSVTDDVGFIDNPRVRKVASGIAGALVFYYVTQRLWPAPIGIYVQGMIIGGLTALIAFGLALVYRANRIINFAAGDLGGVPAALSVLLILGPGINYFLAVPIGLCAALALGGFVEFVFIRRFFKAPRLILTVATIAVSQILAGVATVLPRAFGLSRPPTDFPSPFGFTFSIGSVVFRGNEVLAMIVVPLVIVALTFLLRYTNIGIAIRASAEGADRASLLGVPVKRIQTIVWVIATVLGFVAIFLRAGIVGLPIGSVLGPTILIRALTAAVLGRMERLPTIFVASLALGMVEATIIFRTGRPDVADGILFLIVLGALLFQRRGATSRVDDDQTSTWQSAREVRPIPRELAGLPEVKWGVRALLGAFTLFLVAFPVIGSDAQTNIAGVVLIFVVVGLSLVVLTGWAGQVSLGQVALMGIGAAIGGYLTNGRGWDLSLAILGAGLAGAAAAMLIGLPALRIRGLFLAVVTLALALATSSVLLKQQYVSWLPTRVARTPLFGRVSVASEDRMYYLCLALLLIAVTIVRGIRRSRTGRVLIAVRENSRAAQSYGVNATVAKLTAFAVSGFIAAMAGAVFVHHQRQLGISAYSVAESREAFTMIVIGGLGSIPGAFLGAFLIKGVGYFSSIFPSVIRPYLNFFTTGVGLLFVLLVVPGGFSQIFYDFRDRGLRWVADRRGLVVPSLVADMRVEGSKGITLESPTLDDAPTLQLDADEVAEAMDGADLAGASPDFEGAVATLPRRRTRTATRTATRKDDDA